MILIEKVEMVMKRLRWKVDLYETNFYETTNPLHHIFKTRSCPPQHRDLIQFENDIIELIKRVTFRKLHNKFQNALRNDINSIKKSRNMFIFADKTRNICETDKDMYLKLLNDNITETYRTSSNAVYSKINKEAKQIANDFTIADRKDCLGKVDAFISLKDHKDNFLSNAKCRLIYPAKSGIGKTSKLFMENINTKGRPLSAVHQWKNTDAVINWFKNIQNKRKSIFMQFDIEEFYPSLSKELEQKGINHASAFVRISNKDINVIMYSRKSLLFDSKNIWIKKTGNPNCDVTMRSYDGAEIGELVGLCILHVLGEKYRKIK